MLALYCVLSTHLHEIEDRIYNQKDCDRNLVIDERTKRVARKVSEVLQRERRPLSENHRVLRGTLQFTGTERPAPLNMVSGDYSRGVQARGSGGLCRRPTHHELGRCGVHFTVALLG